MCSFFSLWIRSSYCCISFIFHTFFYLSLRCIYFFWLNKLYYYYYLLTLHPLHQEKLVALRDRLGHALGYTGSAGRGRSTSTCSTGQPRGGFRRTSTPQAQVDAIEKKNQGTNENQLGAIFRNFSNFIFRQNL